MSNLAVFPCTKGEISPRVLEAHIDGHEKIRK